MTNQSNNPIKAASGGDYVRGGRLSGCRLYSNKRRRIDNLEACQSQSWHAKPSAFGAARFLAADFIKLPPALASLSLSLSPPEKKNVSIYRRCLPAARLSKENKRASVVVPVSRMLSLARLILRASSGFYAMRVQWPSVALFSPVDHVKCKLASPPVRRP